MIDINPSSGNDMMEHDLHERPIIDNKFCEITLSKEEPSISCASALEPSSDQEDLSSNSASPAASSSPKEVAVMKLSPSESDIDEEETRNGDDDVGATALNEEAEKEEKDMKPPSTDTVNLDEDEKDISSPITHIEEDENLNKTQKMMKKIRRTGVAVGGGALVGVGLIFIPTLPPPFGEVLIVGGVSLLGTEFEAPKKVVRAGRDKLAKVVAVKENEDGGDTTAEEETETATVSDRGKKKLTMKERAILFGRRHVLPFLDQVVGDDVKSEDDKSVKHDEVVGDGIVSENDKSVKREEAIGDGIVLDDDKSVKCDVVVGDDVVLDGDKSAKCDEVVGHNIVSADNTSVAC